MNYGMWALGALFAAIVTGAAAGAAISAGAYAFAGVLAVLCLAMLVVINDCFREMGRH